MYESRKFHMCQKFDPYVSKVGVVIYDLCRNYAYKDLFKGKTGHFGGLNHSQSEGKRGRSMTKGTKIFLGA